MPEETLYECLDDLGKVLNATEIAQGELCTSCACTLRPLLHCLDLFYECLCGRLREVRRPLGEATPEVQSV